MHDIAQRRLQGWLLQIGMQKTICSLASSHLDYYELGSSLKSIRMSFLLLHAYTDILVFLL